jgi:hypothetical protein
MDEIPNGCWLPLTGSIENKNGNNRNNMAVGSSIIVDLAIILA